MSYKNAYCHMFNQISKLTALMEATDGEKELLNIVSALKQLQVESEEICISDAVCKATRCGSTR